MPASGLLLFFAFLSFFEPLPEPLPEPPPEFLPFLFPPPLFSGFLGTEGVALPRPLLSSEPDLPGVTISEDFFFSGCSGLLGCFSGL